MRVLPVLPRFSTLVTHRKHGRHPRLATLGAEIPLGLARLATRLVEPTTIAASGSVPYEQDVGEWSAGNLLHQLEPNCCEYARASE